MPFIQYTEIPHFCYFTWEACLYKCVYHIMMDWQYFHFSLYSTFHFSLYSTSCNSSCDVEWPFFCIITFSSFFFKISFDTIILILVCYINYFAIKNELLCFIMISNVISVLIDAYGQSSWWLCNLLANIKVIWMLLIKLWSIFFDSVFMHIAIVFWKKSHAPSPLISGFCLTHYFYHWNIQCYYHRALIYNHHIIIKPETCQVLILKL